jgi:hypothetical protein
MSDSEPSPKTAGELIEEWQTGLFFVLGSVVVGVVVALIGGRFINPLPLFFAGSIFGFLAFSYLVYGV